MILKTAQRALVAGALGAFGLGAQAASYSFQTIVMPGVAAGSYWGMGGMNDNGQILMSVSELNVSWDFTLVNDVYDVASKTLTPLAAVPGADANSTVALGINNSGQIVGNYHTPGHQWQAYLYSGGAFTTLTPPGGPSATPFTISNNGQIAGVVSSADFTVSHGFTLANGTYTLIDAAPSPANSTAAFAVNNAGTVIGGYGPSGSNATLPNSFMDAGGVITTLNMPGYQLTQASSLNDAGAIVGSASNDGFTTGVGFILRAGVYTPVSVPGSSNTYISSIDNHGDIAGTYIDAQGSNQFFYATPLPVPEPATWALMLCGAFGLRLAVGRARRSGPGAGTIGG